MWTKFKIKFSLDYVNISTLFLWLENKLNMKNQFETKKNVNIKLYALNISAISTSIYIHMKQIVPI